jgi:glutathione synthase
MSKKLGIVMDPIQRIKPHKDTGFALMLEAQQRGYTLYYMEQQDLFARKDQAFAKAKQVNVTDNNEHWFDFNSDETIKLAELDVILMRKDPPFDMNYIYTTYLLELAERQGAKVVNKPQSLRDANEKLFTTWFPECMPETLISSQKGLLKDFVNEQSDVILKPLDGMGGAGIFHVTQDSDNLSVITELLTKNYSTPIMAQRYLPEVRQGDKRILMIHGKPASHALARIPQQGEARANIAAGGSVKAVELSDRDKWLCKKIGPTLVDKGLLFVGLDVIGDFVTEINVTAPTCARELKQFCNIDLCADFFEGLINQ